MEERGRADRESGVRWALRCHPRYRPALVGVSHHIDYHHRMAPHTIPVSSRFGALQLAMLRDPERHAIEERPWPREPGHPRSPRAIISVGGRAPAEVDLLQPPLSLPWIILIDSVHDPKAPKLDVPPSSSLLQEGRG